MPRTRSKNTPRTTADSKVVTPPLRRCVGADIIAFPPKNSGPNRAHDDRLTQSHRARNARPVNQSTKGVTDLDLDAPALIRPGNHGRLHGKRVHVELI